MKSVKNLNSQELMKSVIQRIATGPELSKNISRDEAKRSMTDILNGEIDPVQSAIFLIALRMKRETMDENIGSLKALGKSDKKTYQMDYSNRNEAIREIDLDLREGADLVMVKPATPNLDIISDLKGTFKVPILAYHVSGEYLMIKSAAKKNVFNERDLVIETLTSIKRAGASSIITYYAKEAAKWMS